MKTDIYTTVILADGRFPYGEFALQFLNAAEQIICCDGAVDGLINYGLEPYAIVGDMDSISEFVKEKYSAIIHESPDQYTNDLTKAVQFCIKKGFKDLVILGATGLREDHAIGNISLVAQYAEEVNVQMVTNHGIFRSIKKTSEFISFPGQQVSIFPLNSETRIISKNLRYPLDEVRFDAWWKGTLNESLADTFLLEMEEGESVIVFQTHQPKKQKG